MLKLIILLYFNYLKIVKLANLTKNQDFTLCSQFETNTTIFKVL